MIVDVATNSDIRRGLHELESARRKRLWREYVNQLIAMTPQLEAAARAVDDHWFKLDPGTQAALVEMRREFHELIQTTLDQHKTPWKRFTLAIQVGWYLYKEPNLLSPANARVKLFRAIDNALEREATRRRFIDEEISSNPEMITSRERGEAQLRARITERISRDQFDHRLKLS